MAFKWINRSQSGAITKDELKTAFKETTDIYIDEEKEKLIEDQYHQIDIDLSGEIELTEWIVAAIDKRSLIQEDKLRLAFGLFDKDHGGSINAFEVRNTLLGDGNVLDAAEEKIWKAIIDEVDYDGNGVIDFYEFETMIKKIVGLDEKGDES